MLHSFDVTFHIFNSTLTQTKTNASVQCAHSPVCVEIRSEVTLVTVLKDTQTKDERSQRGVKVGPLNYPCN